MLHLRVTVGPSTGPPVVNGQSNSMSTTLNVGAPHSLSLMHSRSGPVMPHLREMGDRVKDKGKRKV